MNDLDQNYLLEVVADFVAHVVLPGIEERGLSSALIWTRRDDAAFQGSVLPVLDDIFRVALNTGLADGLFTEVEILAASTDKGLIQPVADLSKQMGSVDTGLNMIFISGLVFVALHEVAHAAGGHPDYRGKGGLNVSWPDEYQTLDELEADGAAAGLTIEFAADIAAMLLERDDPVPETSCLTTGAILGVLLALSATPKSATNGYPDKNVRILNVLSAIAWRVADIRLEAHRGDWRWPKLTKDGAEAASVALRRTVFPALMLLNDSHGAEAGFPDIFAATAKSEKEYAGDMIKTMVGKRPVASVAGAALNELSDMRPDYLRRLAEFRRTKLWAAT